MTVTLRDTQTGEQINVDDPDDSWCWTEGNWSCDCNRCFDSGHDGSDNCESVRYLVIASDHPEFDFDRWNHDYPQELREKHRPKP